AAFGHHRLNAVPGLCDIVRKYVIYGIATAIFHFRYGPSSFSNATKYPQT
ncbi:hypothetical protein AAVH_23905, partial [Aphelenchoides avenae]